MVLITLLWLMLIMLLRLFLFLELISVEISTSVFELGLLVVFGPSFGFYFRFSVFFSRSDTRNKIILYATNDSFLFMASPLRFVLLMMCFDFQKL